MAAIDALPKAMRALVHEFGFVIVRDMIVDGYTNARELRSLLQTWRERRQDAWLATDYVTKRSAAMIVQAALYRASAASIDG